MSYGKQKSYSNFNSMLKTAAKTFVPGAYNHYKNYKPVLDQLMSRSSLKQAKLSTAKALKSTSMGRYLDKTYVKKCGVEVKHYQNNSATFAIGTSFGTGTGTVQPQDLAIPTGLQDSNRTGNTIELKALKCNFTLTINAASTLPVRVRLMMVRLGQNAGSPPTGGQLLWSPADIRSLRFDKREVNRSYTILSEKNFLLTPTALGSGRSRIDFSWNYFPKGCHEVVWLDTDTTGAVANITKGQIYFYSMYETAGVAGAPALTQFCEYQYSDI